jgi:hypothetical protein
MEFRNIAYTFVLLEKKSSQSHSDEFESCSNVHKLRIKICII